MALTAIEMHALEAHIQACRKFNEDSKIDWEQREWELFQSIVIQKINAGMSFDVASLKALSISSELIKAYRNYHKSSL